LVRTLNISQNNTHFLFLRIESLQKSIKCPQTLERLQSGIKIQLWLSCTTWNPSSPSLPKYTQTNIFIENKTYSKSNT